LKGKVIKHIDSKNLEAVSSFGQHFSIECNKGLPPVGSVVSMKTIRHSNFGVFLRTKDDLTWEQLGKETVGYFVGKGQSAKATCRGCQRAFSKDELRVKTRLEMGGLYPKIAYISFCFSSKCINDGIKRYSNTKVCSIDMIEIVWKIECQLCCKRCSYNRVDIQSPMHL
jgi:hypothetical protein